MVATTFCGYACYKSAICSSKNYIIAKNLLEPQSLLEEEVNIMNGLRLPTCLSILIFLLCLIAVPSIVHAQQTNSTVQEVRQRMELTAGGAVAITQSSVTGLATFVAPENPIPSYVSPTAPPEVRASGFLETYGNAFGYHRPRPSATAARTGAR